MKKKKWAGVILLCICMMLTAAGCKKRDPAANAEYVLYYLNQEKTVLLPKEFVPTCERDNLQEMVSQIAQAITETSDSIEFQRVYPEAVKLEHCDYENGQVLVYFSREYLELKPDEEALCRAAIVKDFIQIQGIRGVSFYVDNAPLLKSNGEAVGVMTRDSFAEDPGEKINNIQVADLTLYFASKDGKGLVSETQHVHYYSSNMSVEKLVMDRLLKGPESSNARAAIPSGTGLVSVSVMDGVCFVNLDQNFLSQDFNISEDVVIYSIVNSLAELPTVEKVQLSVNGETNIVYRQDRSMAETYTMNLDLIQEEGEDVDVIQQDNKEGLIDAGP